MPATRFLDAATRSHLFDIVMGNTAPVSEPFISDPAGEGGAVTRKYGYTAALPAGGGGAGRYRLLKRTKAGRTTWYKATHVGENSYTYEAIAIPRCGLCHGTNDIKCTTCNGTGMTGPAGFRVPCAACGIGGLPRGAIRCTRCGPHPKIVAGATVDPIYANWG